MIEHKKKDEEDKIMTKEDKRQIDTRPNEMTCDVQNLTNNQLDMVNQLLLANQELNMKDMEIKNLRLEINELKNDLRYEREINERMNKPN